MAVSGDSPTQFKIRASDWNKRKGSPKPGYIHSESISRALSLIEDEVLGIAYKLKADLKNLYLIW